MTYLERYQKGEREQVWAELMALGAQVRQEPTLSDARAVARETMTRVRSNISLIVERLNAIHYLYESRHVFTPPAADVVAHLDAFERAVGPIPLSVRAWCEVVGSVNLMGNYLGLAYYGSSMPSSFMNLVKSNLTNMSAFVKDLSASGGAPPDAADIPEAALDEVSEKLRQTIPPGLVDLVKGQIAREEAKPAWAMHQQMGAEAVVVSDPLVIEIEPHKMIEEYQNWIEDYGDDPDVPFMLLVEPDSDHKSNFSGGGGYGFNLPDPNADTVVVDKWHNTSFVNYLRICFQWGGFPGLEDHPDNRSDDLIAYLKADLLPI